jgi:hypothetical protein
VLRVCASTSGSAVFLGYDMYNDHASRVPSRGESVANWSRHDMDTYESSTAGERGDPRGKGSTYMLSGGAH